MHRRIAITTLALALLASAGVSSLPAPARASSHSEAPGTAKDRLADDTDLYAWVSPDAKDKVTIVGNWVPLLEPNSGPNFFGFDDDAHYYVNIDNVGDAKAHIRFEFEFKTTRRNPDTFLYNTGVVNAISDATLNVVQTYTVTRWDDGTPTVLGSDLPVAPAFVGPVSMPRYEALAQSAVRTLSDGTKVFVGPRDDPFYVDLAAIFDLLTIRKPPGDRGKGVDGLGGFDVMTIALQVPMTRLTSDGQSPNPGNSVIGIYDTAERPASRVLNGDGTVTVSGAEIQVSRLGMPLVNEVVIPLQDKDRFNATKPTGDGAFLPYVLDPELARLLTLVHGISTPPAPRNDLVAVFLTGIPSLNQPANPNQQPCEMLRLNLSIPPAAKASRLGLLGGDVAGFPNGRRPSDDVVDIAERVVAGATPFTPEFNVAPNNRLGDGLDANDRPFLPYFPYVAPPHDPLDHEHHAKVTRGLVDAFEERMGEASASDAKESTLGSALKVIGRNPASSSRLSFTLPASGRVKLEVFDVQGRKVRTLLEQDAAPGEFAVSWNGLDDHGARVVKGVYFARLVSGEQVSERKIVME
jgi:hypothetical protein